MKYYYGMRLRGFSIGCQPMGGLTGVREDKEGRYHSILEYARGLTESEMYDYDLDELATLHDWEKY